MRLSASPSEIGPNSALPSASPFPVEMRHTEVQVDLISTDEVTAFQTDVKVLKADIERDQFRIAELEGQLEKSHARTAQNEQLKKLKFDNQVLMTRLSEYKKAERGARDLCADYEQMKLKYFNALTENEKHKTQIAGQITEAIAMQQSLLD